MVLIVIVITYLLAYYLLALEIARGLFLYLLLGRCFRWVTDWILTWTAGH